MFRLSAAVCCLCLAGISDSGHAQEEEKPKPRADAHPTFAELFGEVRDYQPGDLITWEDVKPYLKQLQEAGEEIPDEENFSSLFLSESDRMVKMLRTRKGTRFMRELIKSGGTYDMLDRFRKLPRGYTMLQTMIDTPHGEQLLADMVTSKTGKGTAEQLSDDPDGKNFTKPTGLIYTEDRLNQFLKSGGKQTPSDESPAPASP